MSTRINHKALDKGLGSESNKRVNSASFSYAAREMSMSNRKFNICSVKATSDECCVLLPNRGRLHDFSVRILQRMRLAEGFQERKLRYRLNSPGGSVMFVRSEDIPSLLSSGIGSIGLTGLDYVLESDAELEVLETLDCCGGHLSLQVRQDSYVSSFRELPAEGVVVSQYPRVTHRALASAGRQDVQVIPINGAAEAYVSSGMADASVDVIASGDTASANAMKVAVQIAYTSAVLVRRSNGKCLGNFEAVIRELATVVSGEGRVALA